MRLDTTATCQFLVMTTAIVALSSVDRTVAAANNVRGQQSQKETDLEARKEYIKNHGLQDYPTHHLTGTTATVNNHRHLKSKKSKRSSHDECDPATVDLSEYPQWQEEEGYWIGEYSFYQSDGTPFESSNWNYRYDAYRGFITGNVKGNAYRQRNVFFYPPQSPEECELDDSVQGVGMCGVNGNTKIFEADQSATTCSNNPALGGDISGPFQGIFDTYTELIGDLENNALLYQVYLFGQLFQSQLTTLTVDAETGQTRRTRSAQGFANGLPIYLSFYRERKVNETTFYNEMQDTIDEYNILESDTCTWVDNPSFVPPVIGTDLPPGIEGCRVHLEESFAL